MTPVTHSTATWRVDHPLESVDCTQALTSPESTDVNVSCAKASRSGILYAICGILLERSTELGSGIVSLPMKLYVGNGHKAPLSNEQRSMVKLMEGIPYTVSARLAVTLTLSSTDAAETLKKMELLAAK